MLFLIKNSLMKKEVGGSVFCDATASSFVAKVRGGGGGVPHIQMQSL
jgi:hypothetical protein